MKTKFAALLLALSAFAAPLAARADLIWYEGFNYADGNLTNVAPPTVWTNISGGLHDMFVVNHILQVGSTSGTLSRSDDDARLFGSPYTNSPEVLYASFTVICTNLPGGPGTYFATFYSTANGFFGRVQAFTNGTVLPNTFRLGVTANGAATNALDGGFPVDLALNTPYQVVEKLNPITLDAATIWVNPISESDATSYTSHDSIGKATTSAVNGYVFRQASSAAGPANNWFSFITNVDVTTTFIEAQTNIASTNATAPVIAYAPVGLTNFVGIPVQLSVVANGQGLAALTYQWLKGGAPFSNPSGNKNILPFASPLATDSGSYSVVVTTPNGLSVTSTAVQVSISAAPVPPMITSGPNSQNLFVGENVIFSVQVTSPGNLSYQWKSNGVNIDGATSSSYEIDNLQTNFSANYSVGVTNDVVPNGVVSTNAVLTVSPANKVSVAFLRSLVDPNTFLPNVPPVQPYQVTGVITTFTNITSGDTASYWLQDGTGGINIFATFGSTFRPNQGDIVQFTGVLSSFNSGLELDANTAGLPQTSYFDTGTTGPLPAPILIPFTVTNTANLSNVNAHIAGSLVTITNVFFGTNAGTAISTTANENVTVTNDSGQSFVVSFFDLDLDTAGQTLPTFAYSVSGVLYGLSPSYSLAVTKFSDIVNVLPTPIPLTIANTNGTITVSWADASFALQSSPVISGPYTNVPSASSPYTASSASGTLYFRLKK